MVATLKASGVRRVYGLPGDSINGFTDALRRDGDMTWQHVRHEEAAAFAAAGEAAVTGELAVCAASCGPGNLHLINGLFDANRSRVPVLAIAAHIPREEIGGSYFQETHPQELFRECSVYSELVSVPEQLPRVLEIAMRAAIERSGVAVVVIPGEIFLHQAARRCQGGRDPADDVDDPPERRRTRRRRRGAQHGRARHDPRRRGLSGGPRRGRRDCRATQGTGRACAPRQGVRRVRQPLRRRDDRPARDSPPATERWSTATRCSCSAPTSRTGRSIPRTRGSCRSTSVARTSAAASRSTSALVGTVKDTIDALLPHLDTERDDEHLARMTAHYRRTRERLDALARTTATTGPSIRRPSPRRSTGSQPTTPSSSPTSAHRHCGPRATCG